MRIAIIGRSEALYDTAELLAGAGFEIGLVVTAKEAAEYTRTAEDFERLAGTLGCPFIRTARIASAVDRIRSLSPIDLGISVNYPGIIPAEVIDSFRLGILNAHAGDLPRYRGNAPLAWAILAGEEKVGLCIHRMVGGELDAGDIIARDYHPLTAETSVTQLSAWFNSRTPALFAEAAARLREDPDFFLERQSEDPRDALRGYPRRPEDGRIDWRRSALDVVRLVNASNWPFAGAFCLLDDSRIVVREAKLGDASEPFLAVPGQVTRVEPGSVSIAAGDGGIVRITRVESGGALISPDTLIRSIRSRLS